MKMIVPALLAVSALYSCASTSRLPAAATGNAQDFILGIYAPAGTPLRQHARDILVSTINGVYTPSRFSKNLAVKTDQIRAKNIFTYAAQSLSNGASCPDNEKIRVYRGIGELPLLRAPRTQKGSSYFGPLNGSIVESLVATEFLTKERIPPNNELDAGELAMAHASEVLPKINWTALPIFVRKDPRDANSPIVRKEIGWPTILGFGRPTTSGGDVNGRWTEIAKSHSRTAPESPLLSVTLDPSVSEQFGPAVLVMDVCPGRLLPSIIDDEINGNNFYETELYLPFAVLPEEVVRIDGIACRNLLRTEKNGKDGCKKGKFGFVDNDSVNSNTSLYWRLFYNFHHPFEKTFVDVATRYGNDPADYIAWPKSLYKKHTKDFYTLLDQTAGSYQAWMKLVRSLNPKPDCETAEGLVQAASFVESDIANNWAGDADAKSALAVFQSGLKEYRAFLVTKGCHPPVP